MGKNQSHFLKVFFKSDWVLECKILATMQELKNSHIWFLGLINKICFVFRI